MAEYRPDFHFVAVPEDLLKAGLDASAIAAYVAVKSFADYGKETGAEVRDEIVAPRAGLSVRSFQDARARLRHAGWLRWERTGRSNRYTVLSFPDPEAGRSADSADQSPAQPGPRSAESADQIGEDSGSDRQQLPAASTDREPETKSQLPDIVRWLPLPPSARPADIIKALAPWQDTIERTVERLSAERLREAQGAAIFSYWALRHNHPEARFDPKRFRKIEALLRQAPDDPSIILWAIDGALRSDFHMGRDPSTNGQKYDGIQTLLRDREQVEKLARLAKGYSPGAIHPLAIKYPEIFQPKRAA